MNEQREKYCKEHEQWAGGVPSAECSFELTCEIYRKTRRAAKDDQELHDRITAFRCGWGWDKVKADK